MQAGYDIGFEEALSRTLRELTPLAPVDLPVSEVGGLTAAQDCVAAVDCPSASTSLKDGYAVVSADLNHVTSERPVRLKVTGRSFAGSVTDVMVGPGAAVKITTGARIPAGADAVVAEEFTDEEDGYVLCYRDAGPRRNIIERGHDVREGTRIAFRGEVLTPAKTGLLAAGGVSAVRVHPRPRVGVIATGDEVVSPGKPLLQGQVYASNVVTLLSWLGRFRMEAEVALVGDRREDLASEIENMLERVDVLITSGGAWKSERDLTIDVLTELGGNLVFHRVRMGPGKAVAMIQVNGKAVFGLPGGPPSNEMAFLQIALPGLLHLAGRPPVPFEHAQATLATQVGGDKDWTQFSYAALKQIDGRWSVNPLRTKSRLQSQANADALIKIPEGLERIEPHEQIQVQVLRDRHRIHSWEQG